jgi:hypothetical protein
MDSATLNSKTAQGLLDFCDYMAKNGYGTPNAMEAWQVAIRKVLTAVEGDEFGATDLTSIDMDDVLQRFQTLTLGRYKPDSVTAYGRRMKNAMEAYFEFLETGRPPQKSRSTTGSKSKAENKAKSKRTPSGSLDASGSSSGGDLIKFPFPLKTGEMAELRLPARIQRDDVDRLSGFLRALQVEPQKELPPRTGEQTGDEAQAA